MNDDDHSVWTTRSTYYANSFAICPVQLKSDLGPTATAYQLRTDMLAHSHPASGHRPYKNSTSRSAVGAQNILRGRQRLSLILRWADGGTGCGPR